MDLVSQLLRLCLVILLLSQASCSPGNRFYGHFGVRDGAGSYGSYRVQRPPPPPVSSPPPPPRRPPPVSSPPPPPRRPPTPPPPEGRFGDKPRRSPPPPVPRDPIRD